MPLYIEMHYMSYLSMFEFDFSFSSGIIFPIDRWFINRSPFYTDDPICTILSEYTYFSIPTAFFYKITTFFEL